MKSRCQTVIGRESMIKMVRFLILITVLDYMSINDQERLCQYTGSATDHKPLKEQFESLLFFPTNLLHVSQVADSNICISKQTKCRGGVVK
jgi:hypothetical protein